MVRFLNLLKQKNNAEQEMQRGVPKRSLADATSSVFNNSIAQDEPIVKSSRENSQKKNLESADKHSAGGDITESTDVYENEGSPFQAAVRRSGIDPDSEAMIRSIEDSSKDLREDERFKKSTYLVYGVRAPIAPCGSNHNRC